MCSLMLIWALLNLNFRDAVSWTHCKWRLLLWGWSLFLFLLVFLGPGTERDDLFNISSAILMNLFEGIANCCPQAIVTFLVILLTQQFQLWHKFSWKLALLTQIEFSIYWEVLDIVRANTFVVRTHNFAFGSSFVGRNFVYVLWLLVLITS